MKLKKKLFINLSIIGFLTIFFIGLLFSYRFSTLYESYVNQIQEERFEKLENHLAYMFNDTEILDVKKELGIFAYMENIEISIFNLDNKLLVKMNPLDQEKEMTKEKFTLLNSGKEIGYVELSFYADVFSNSNYSVFENRLFKDFFLVAIVIFILNLSLSYSIANSLTKNIGKVSRLASKIKREEFQDYPDLDTNIIEIQNLYNDLKYLGDSLKIQEELRLKYAQDISHELRTPLTNLKVHIEAAKDGVIQMDKENLDIILSDVNHLTMLISKLRNSFDYASENFIVKKEKINLSQLLMTINKSLHTSAHNLGLVLKSEIQNSVNIISDKEKITQIMYNLISNAIKASKKGDIIEVKLHTVKNYAVIEVKDQGMGISKENQIKIFERFYQVEESRNYKYGGSGLGLSITKKMVEALQGEIEVNSILEEGSTFIVKLPLN